MMARPYGQRCERPFISTNLPPQPPDPMQFWHRPDLVTHTVVQVKASSAGEPVEIDVAPPLLASRTLPPGPLDPLHRLIEDHGYGDPVYEHIGRPRQNLDRASGALVPFRPCQPGPHPLPENTGPIEGEYIHPSLTLAELLLRSAGVAVVVGQSECHVGPCEIVRYGTEGSPSQRRPRARADPRPVLAPASRWGVLEGEESGRARAMQKRR
jgi:hypothetical protein